MPTRLSAASHPQKPVNEEEEDAAHALAHVAFADMPCIEYEQHNVHLMHAVEQVEEPVPHRRHSYDPHHNFRHRSNNPRQVRNPVLCLRVYNNSAGINQ